MAYAQSLARETIARFDAAGLAGRVRVELIRHDQVNAFASRRGEPSDGYLVGIHDALFVALDESLGDFARRMTVESFDPGRGLGFRPETYAVLEQHSEIVIGRMVNQLATYFIVLHEMAHIINGHLGLLHASGLGEEILEAYGRRATPGEAIRLQAMEINADATATISWAGQLMGTSLHSAESEFGPLARDLRFQFWGWFLSIGCLFMLLGFRSHDLEELDRLAHPPALMRVTMVADQTGRWMQKRFGGAIADLIDLAVSAYDQAERRFFAEDRPLVTAADRDPRAYEHYIAIGRAWQTLGPDLEKYKHGGRFGRVVMRDD